MAEVKSHTPDSHDLKTVPLYLVHLRLTGYQGNSVIMSLPTQALRTGEFWPRLLEREGHALECGALQPIQTDQTVIEQGGVQYLVRWVSSLVRKQADKRTAKPHGGKPANPFLPPETDLTIGPLFDSHLCIFNKFNVIEHHVLIVTREFEHQECLLNAQDFACLHYCLQERDGLGFYNGGKVAGASQPHKHLQWIALPLATNGPAVPIAPLLDAHAPVGKVTQCPALPLPHAYVRLSADGFDPDRLYHHYTALLEAIGVDALSLGDEVRQSSPYNLLLTKDWMLAVPRRRECHEGISVNALGFAGSLFVREREQLGLIESVGPLNVLQAVTD